MLRFFLITALFLCSTVLFAQDFASTQANLSNYAKRVYAIEKFDGVKIIETDTEKFLIIIYFLFFLLLLLKVLP